MKDRIPDFSENVLLGQNELRKTDALGKTCDCVGVIAAGFAADYVIKESGSES